MKTHHRNIAALIFLLVLLTVLGAFAYRKEKRKKRSGIVLDRWDAERRERERERGLAGELFFEEEEEEAPLILRRGGIAVEGRRAQDAAGNQVIAVDGLQQQQQHQDAVRDALQEQLGYEIMAAEARYVARALGEGPPVEQERPIMGYDPERLRVNAQVLHDDMVRDYRPARR